VAKYWNIFYCLVESLAGVIVLPLCCVLLHADILELEDLGHFSSWQDW